MTINEENWLQTRVKELTEKNRDTEYVISAKLLEKDEEIKDIKEQLRAIFSTINSSSQSGKIEIARKLVQISDANLHDFNYFPWLCRWVVEANNLSKIVMASLYLQ